jgi:hypothetical protein
LENLAGTRIDVAHAIANYRKMHAVTSSDEDARPPVSLVASEREMTSSPESWSDDEAKPPVKPAAPGT